MKIYQHTARSLPGDHLVQATVFTCPKATGNAEWYLKGSDYKYKPIVQHNAWHYTWLRIIEFGYICFSFFFECVYFGLMCHMFYLQADDVCQVYMFSSFHPVLALAQTCKPADEKTHKMKNNCEIRTKSTVQYMHILNTYVCLLPASSCQEPLTKGKWVTM